MTRLALLAAAVLLAAATPAVPTPPPPPPDYQPDVLPPAVWLPKTQADLIVLDKVSAKTTPLTLKVGQLASNGSLSIALRACDVHPADQAQDAVAYLDITDSRPGVAAFHGWMFHNEPGVNVLEDPVYGVLLVGCH